MLVKRNNLVSQQQQLQQIIADFNEVSTHINALEANVAYILPRMRRDMGELANHIKEVQTRLETEIQQLKDSEADV